MKIKTTMVDATKKKPEIVPSPCQREAWTRNLRVTEKQTTTGKSSQIYVRPNANEWEKGAYAMGGGGRKGN